MKHGFILAGLAALVVSALALGRSVDCAARRNRAGTDPGIFADGCSAAGPTGRDPAARAITQLCLGAQSLVVERLAVFLAALGAAG